MQILVLYSKFKTISMLFFKKKKIISLSKLNKQVHTSDTGIVMSRVGWRLKFSRLNISLAGDEISLQVGS